MRRLFVLAALLAIVCYWESAKCAVTLLFRRCSLWQGLTWPSGADLDGWKCLKRINGEVPIFLVDMDYTSKGVAAGYWEIARELRFWQPPFSIHVEYNGGASNSFSYNNAYLGGATYTWNNPDFTKGFTLTAMYKYIQKHREPNNFQLTGTWYVHFVKNGLCTFSGFADWWRERTDYADGSHRNFIFLADRSSGWILTS